jgi:hypothetical protein
MQVAPITADPLSVHFSLLDGSLVERAFDLASPLIEAALDTPDVSADRFLHVVVVDPDPPRFDDAVLAERSFGHAATSGGVDYRGFARAKAQLAWRTSLDTRQVQQSAPHLLRAGDTLLWGSACRDGLIVAASGAQPWFDEAFSGVVLELVRALVQARRRALRSHE